MRIVYANAVFCMEPGPDRLADGKLAKRAGFRWHDYDHHHPQHRADCDGCQAGVPNRYWWTAKAEVAGKLYHEVAQNPDQAPDTLVRLYPHRPLGGEEYTGEPDPVPPPRDTTGGEPDQPPKWAPQRRSLLELALGEKPEED